MTLLSEFLPVAPVEPLSVEQYHAMIRTGILAEGEAVELIDGVLVRKDRRDTQGDIMTVGPRHAEVLGLLTDAFHDQLKSLPVHARSQLPLTLTDLSEPEPDLAIVHGSRRDYGTEHPGPLQVYLTVEVADSSLHFDRNSKYRLYAAAGIPEYWIVNLKDNVIEVFRDPQPGAESYGQRQEFLAGDSIPFEVSGTSVLVPVSSILT